MPNETLVAGRSLPEVYSLSGRQDIHAAIAAAIEASGGRVIFASESNRAPHYFGVQTDRDERIGILIYPFRLKQVETKNRPADEVRAQIRYGGEGSWNRDHFLASDIAGVDTTLVIAVDPERDVLLGLDPLLYSPLPMGISVYAKLSDLDKMGDDGWHVWEKEDRAGTKRSEARSASGLEIFVAFRGDRLLDYVRLERRATDLRLDTPLRFSAAASVKSRASAVSLATQPHSLETQFNLSSKQILEIIANRSRLSVAVRGGVAEHHLQSLLEADSEVATVEPLDIDATHDFNVKMKSGQALRIECKNASPNKYADGAFKVEVQKTRASKGDPAGRLYPVTNFDVVAACLFSPTSKWVFKFARTINLARHPGYGDRLNPMQRVDGTWADSLGDLA